MKKIFKKKKFHYVTLLLLVILLGTLGNLGNNFSYGDFQENERNSIAEPKKSENDGHSPKIHPQIIKIIAQNQTENKTIGFGVASQSNEIEVYVHVNSEFQNNIPNNFNILSQDNNVIFTKLTFDQIQDLSNLDSIEAITMPINAISRAHAVSEGVEWSFADDMHALGFTGSGVTVGVIDDGFDSLNPEISGNIGFSSFQIGCGNLLCGTVAGNSHGTAVAEAVADMAPNVNLRVYSVLNTVGFNNAVDDAIANNVDIITTSLAFIGAGGDGTTGQYRDGTSTVARKINEAKNTGILVTAAVGNQGQSHWQGTYSPSTVTPGSIGLNPATYQSVMDFRPAEAGVQRACLPVTDVGSTYLASWNDWFNTNQDYDLFLYNAAMNSILDLSADVQDGIGLDNPLEIIPPAGPFAPSTLCLVIASDSSTQNHFFHINTEGNSVNDPNKVRAGSLDTPADAIGALAVGAINQATDVLEPFSSSGPTDDLRNKPEICASDNTLSHQLPTSGLNPFFGTSAATPHVAGGAALLLEQNPNLSVDQLRHKLIDEARFNASYSVNNLCGGDSGALSLQSATTTDVYIPLGVSTPGCEITNSCVFPFTHTISPGTQVTWYNGDTVAQTVTSGSAAEGPSGVFDSSLLLSGTTFSHTFNLPGTFPYFSMVYPWVEGIIVVNSPPPCIPPISGNWIVTSSCTLQNNSTISGNVIVQNNSILIIPNGIILNINFETNNLTVTFGSIVLIESGGLIT